MKCRVDGAVTSILVGKPGVLVDAVAVEFEVRGIVDLGLEGVEPISGTITPVLRVPLGMLGRVGDYLGEQIRGSMEVEHEVQG